MARLLTVILGDTWAEFCGGGSRELYTSLRGRPPVYNSRTRRWTAQLSTARDLVALAESRGWDVAVVGSDDCTAGQRQVGQPKRQQEEGLW